MNKKIISIILLVDKQIFCVSQKFNVCSMFVCFLVQRCQPAHKTGLCVEVIVQVCKLCRQVNAHICNIYVISQLDEERVRIPTPTLR